MSDSKKNMLIDGRFYCREEQWGYLVQDLINDRMWAVDAYVFQNIGDACKCPELYRLSPYHHQGTFELGKIGKKDSLRAPLSISWSLTGMCNSRCRFCCTDSMNASCMGNEASLRTIEHIVETLLQWGVLRIILGGGEPLLRPDIIEILDIFGAHQFQPVIATNGILLEGEKRAAVLKNCMNVQVSLDSLREDTYYRLRGVDQLKRVKQNIYATAQLAKCMRIVTVVTKENIGELFELARFIANCGIRQWFIFDLLNSGRGTSCYKELYWDDKAYLFRVIREIKEQFPDLSIWFWGDKKADGCAVYVLPDGRVGMTDYHSNTTVLFSEREMNLSAVSLFWNQVENSEKLKILDNFLSGNHLEG